jgi:hypothetical protein
LIVSVRHGGGDSHGNGNGCLSAGNRFAFFFFVRFVVIKATVIEVAALHTAEMTAAIMLAVGASTETFLDFHRQSVYA